MTDCEMSETINRLNYRIEHCRESCCHRWRTWQRRRQLHALRIRLADYRWAVRENLKRHNDLLGLGVTGNGGAAKRRGVDEALALIAAR